MLKEKIGILPSQAVKETETAWYIHSEHPVIVKVPKWSLGFKLKSRIVKNKKREADNGKG